MVIDLTTTVIAVAGIAGAVLAPVVAERMRREGYRREQLVTRRIDTYAELLNCTSRMANNALHWAKLPTAEIRDGEVESSALASRARVIASDAVLDAFHELDRSYGAFDRFRRTEVVPDHMLLVSDDQGDDDETRRRQAALEAMAEEIVEAYFRLESAVRTEMNPR